MPPKCKKQKVKHDSSSSSPSSSLPPPPPSSFPARSLDDDDDPAPAPSSAASSSRPASLDPHVVELCESLMSLHERLKGLDEGRFVKEEGCSDVFEVARDRVGGSLTITRLRENIPGLSVATRQAKEDVVNEVAKRKADFEGLKKEVAAMEAKIMNCDPDEAENLTMQLMHLLQMLGKHCKSLRELESKSEVEVKVEVERVSTRMELLKEETVVVQKETKMVPMHGAGIYVVGGCDEDETIISSVERYDPKEDRWEVLAPMAAARYEFSSVVLGDMIYAIGGRDNDGRPLATVEVFSTRKRSWVEGVPMAAARSGFVSGALERKIYVAGGFKLSSLVCFDVKANSWTELAPMSCPRYNAAGAVLGGFFYVLGGSGIGVDGRTAERCDVVSNAWELVPPMKHARVSGAAAVLNGCLYVLGGLTQHATGDALSSVERFEPRLNRWEDVAPMTSNRWSLAAVVLDGWLYAIGGERSDSCDEVDFLSSVERFNVSTNRWEPVSPMAEARSGLSAAVASKPI